MKSLLLAILMGVILSLASAAQQGGKDVVVPSRHPGADLKSYTQYEDVLDRIAAYRAADLRAYTQYEDVLDRIAAYDSANLKPHDQYEDVLDRIEVYLAELQRLRSGIAQKDNDRR